MTVISNVKTALANMKGIQSTFSRLALITNDPEARQVFHECMMETESIIEDLGKRIEYMKAEEPQYNKS